jgi:hypothetical protein
MTEKSLEEIEAAVREGRRRLAWRRSLTWTVFYALVLGLILFFVAQPDPLTWLGGEDIAGITNWVWVALMYSIGLVFEILNANISYRHTF